MVMTLDLSSSQIARGVPTAPSILDLLRRGDLLDGDIDAAVDAYLTDPSLGSCLLHSLYRIDFAEINAAMRASASCFSNAGERDDRQALMCDLLLHRRHLVQSLAAEQRD